MWLARTYALKGLYQEGPAITLFGKPNSRLAPRISAAIVGVADQVLHLFEGHAVFKQVGDDGDAEGMRRAGREGPSGGPSSSCRRR
jgi:hypothetical protein